jgi:hypothetical protein
MVLIIDYRQNESRLLLADGNSVRSFCGERGAGFDQLNCALDELGKEARPDGIAVVLPEKSGTDDVHMSWSTVRAAVSMANSLAFAWGVPAVGFSGGAGGELVTAAVEALRGADASSRVSAFYDGEPNITKPKA